MCSMDVLALGLLSSENVLHGCAHPWAYSLLRMCSMDVLTLGLLSSENVLHGCAWA